MKANGSLQKPFPAPAPPSGADPLARHRASTTLAAKDIQLALEKNWNMRLVGVGDSAAEIKVIKKTAVTDAHKGRLADVRRSKQLHHK